MGLLLTKLCILWSCRAWSLRKASLYPISCACLWEIDRSRSVSRWDSPSGEWGTSQQTLTWESSHSSSHNWMWVLEGARVGSLGKLQWMGCHLSDYRKATVHAGWRLSKSVALGSPIQKPSLMLNKETWRRDMACLIRRDKVQTRNTCQQKGRSSCLHWGSE